MSNTALNFVCESDELNHLLSAEDVRVVDALSKHYDRARAIMPDYERTEARRAVRSQLIAQYAEMGAYMKDIVSRNERIKVYSFSTPTSIHGEASRVISKLRNRATQNAEFIYYIQRAYELLFHLVFAEPARKSKNHLIVPTPLQNYAVHKIPDIDRDIDNVSMCVILRGALLPSMIVSKEIEEYSSYGKITPFALFDVKRRGEAGKEKLRYMINLKRCFFNATHLHGADVIIADPMNATAGSVYTIIKYLEEQGIFPRTYLVLNVISSVTGALRLIRCRPNVHLYTLWMDPALNEHSYILPGLGDAGDRINGSDPVTSARNIIQLIADYGSTIANLYRSQIRIIEETVLQE